MGVAVGSDLTDSHLRDSYFLDEIYDLKSQFAKSRPKS
jgi:hypothetical protein